MPPIMLLFIVLGVGYLFGTIPLMGIRLGVAGVLFVGLFAGAMLPEAEIPEMIPAFGLVVFIYTVGLATGPSFRELFRTSGLRDTGIALVILTLAALLTAGIAHLLDLEGPLASGLFCGAITNTPALAAVRELLATQPPDSPLAQAASLPVVGYSVAYPFGVVGVVAALALYRGIFNVEIPQQEDERPLIVRNYQILNPALFNRSLADVMGGNNNGEFIVTRVNHRGESNVATRDTVLYENDIVAVLIEEEALGTALNLFGAESPTHIEEDRTILDYRRIFVSSKSVIGKSLKTLRIPEIYGGLLTRLKRGDKDIIPTANTILEAGDRVRVLAKRDNLPAISKFLGDSIRGSGEMHLGSFAIGITLGVLLGLAPLPFPGGSVKLGLAGGCLIVAIILGSVGQTGPLMWRLPVPANLSLRELGIALFLAGVGVRAGNEFFAAISVYGVSLLFGGALLTLFVSLSAIIITHRYFKLPYDYVMGLVAGLHTQPSVLGFANGLTAKETPNTAYASIYPAATLAKIVLTQILVRL